MYDYVADPTLATKHSVISATYSMTAEFDSFQSNSWKDELTYQFKLKVIGYNGAGTNSAITWLDLNTANDTFSFRVYCGPNSVVTITENSLTAV